MNPPAGESLWIVRWRAKPEQFWEFPARSPWALRLVQIQVSLLYLSARYHKPDGETWTSGEPLSYVWPIDDIVRFHVPTFLQQSLTLSAEAAFLALTVELLIGFMV